MEWQAALGPLVSPLGLELFDVELAAGTLEVVVTRPGGVDVDTLATASRAISAWLDEHDPIPSHYTLDVSSPGLERRLRTPAHFAGALGEVVTLRELRAGEATRRVEGTLRRANETTVVLEDDDGTEVEVVLANVERARTVFAWGSTHSDTTSAARR